MKHFLLITCILLASLLTSCSPRIVEHLVIQRDTTYLSSHVRDSVYLHDSVYVKEFIKGDTVRITEYRERWRDKIREVHDTSYISVTDTILIKKTVTKEVDKPIRGFKKIKLNAFWWILAIAAIGWRKEILKLIRKFV